MTELDRVHAAAAREAWASVRSLAAVERAIEEGHLNTAKVLRAHALGARQRALALARLVDDGASSSDAVAWALDTTRTTEDAIAGASGVLADVIHRSAASAAATLAATNNALLSERDVSESTVAQFVWVCEVCGLMIEAARPEVCPSCGCIGGEFALFAPFFSGTNERIARKQPAEIVGQLREDGALLAQALAGREEASLCARPAAEEWCVKEIAGHMVDIAELADRRMRASFNDEEPPRERTVLPWRLLESENYAGTPAATICARFSASLEELVTLLSGLDDADWRARIDLVSGRTLAVDVGSWVANHNTAHLEQIKARLVALT